jgi:hypothetical protein
MPELEYGIHRKDGVRKGREVFLNGAPLEDGQELLPGFMDGFNEMKEEEQLKRKLRIDR